MSPGASSVACAGGDTASRSGGGEFIVVLSEIAQPEDAVQVATKILTGLSDPIDLNGELVPIPISIGIAVYPIDSTDDLRELLRRADKAMYAAKFEGRNCYRFYGSDLQGPAPAQA